MKNIAPLHSLQSNKKTYLNPQSLKRGIAKVLFKRTNDMSLLLRRLNQYLEEYVASALFILFSVLMFTNVVMRYAFQDAIPWAEELTLLIFVWFVWFVIPLTTKLDGHAKITMVQDLLPNKLKSTLKIAIDIGAIFIFSAIVMAAIKFLDHNAVRGKTGLLIAYPMWLFYIPAPIGLTLTILRLLQNMSKDMREILGSASGAKGE